MFVSLSDIFSCEMGVIFSIIIKILGSKWTIAKKRLKTTNIAGSIMMVGWSLEVLKIQLFQVTVGSPSNRMQRICFECNVVLQIG